MTVVLVSLLSATKRHNYKRCVDFGFVMAWRLLQESHCVLGKSARSCLKRFAIDVLHQPIE
jgi:hypothetical protein